MGKAIEKELGINAKINLLPIQPGDVPETFADVDALMTAVDYKPSTTVSTGIKNFIDWYISTCIKYQSNKPLPRFLEY